MDLNELRDALTSADTTWSAAETEFSRMGRELRRMRYGVPETDDADSLWPASNALSPPYPSTRVAPRAFDWRSNKGDWIGAARDQGPCPSCTAFALCGIMEARYRIDSKNPDALPLLSPADLYFCGKDAEDGMLPTVAVSRAKSHGVGLESDAPYRVGQTACEPVSAAFRITESSLVSGDQRVRKLLIADEGPVLGVMRVYEDLSFYTKGVYRHAAGASEGLHSVIIAGYNDDDGCWIVRNSWGTGFGEGGYLRIGYGECELDKRPFISVEVEPVAAS